MQHTLRKSETRTTFLSGEDHVGDPGVDGRIIPNSISEKYCVKADSGLNWLKIGFNDVLL
jgi:hypothetical protein